MSEDNKINTPVEQNKSARPRETKLFGRVHNNDNIAFLREKIPNDFVDLTLTSPPIYDENLYTNTGGEGEFGWKTFDQYLAHLSTLLEELFRVTKPGGMLVVETMSGPNEHKKQIKKLFPIPARITLSALEKQWEFWDEVIIVGMPNNIVSIPKHSPPTAQNKMIHKQLLVFRKPGKKNQCRKAKGHYLNSIWTITPNKREMENYADYSYGIFSEHLIKRVLSLWSCQKDIVLDPFAGTGQVIRIGKKFRRRVFGIEIDPKLEKYWDDINKPIQKVNEPKADQKPDKDTT